MESKQKTNHIGLLNEKSLHAALKEWYARPGDQLEVPVDGFIVDIMRGSLLVEIQTRSFASIKAKLAKLSRHHPVRLVYPLAVEKWIVKLPQDEYDQMRRRKSPKKAMLADVFHELVSVPDLIASANFSLEVLLIQEEELRHYDKKRAWRRRGWVTHERRLLGVVGQRLFETPEELCALLPAQLNDPFTTADLAVAVARPQRLAQQMAYCLRKLDAITPIGKQGRFVLYTRTEGTGACPGT